jgi:hypothetical protein
LLYNINQNLTFAECLNKKQPFVHHFYFFSMKIIVILLQLLGGATLIPWAFGAMMSPMLFDSPNSAQKLFPYLIMGGLFLYPILMGGCFWYAWKMEEMTKSALLSAVPLVLAGIVGAYIMAS